MKVSMAVLHLFNPSHDEALAAHSPFYYPGKAARTLATDLAMLPAWWAAEGDYVLLPDEVDPPAEGDYPPGVHFIYQRQLNRQSAKRFTQIFPWGWDALLVRQLRTAGIAEELLPTQHELDGIRQLSCRETAVGLLAQLREILPECEGRSYWCTNEEETLFRIAQEGKVMVKAPWSSSGRGVFVCQHPVDVPQLQRIRRILHTQGAVAIEPFYPHSLDFALEFSAGPAIAYEGLSLFSTSANGGYAGNLLLPDDELERFLPTNIATLLPRLRLLLKDLLTPLLLPHYQGPFGIDMMVVETHEGPRLHPCVEINLRRTMGHVACLLRQNIPLAGPHRLALLPISQIPLEQLRWRLTPTGKTIQAVLLSNDSLTL